MILMKISFNESQVDIIRHQFRGNHEKNLQLALEKYL